MTDTATSSRTDEYISERVLEFDRRLAVMDDEQTRRALVINFAQQLFERLLP